MALVDLITEARFTLTELSRESRVSVPTIQNMLDGIAVRSDKAGNVCDALSERLGRTISIQEAAIKTIPLRGRG